MIDIGKRVRFLTGFDLKGTVIGHTFYKRPPFETLDPGYVVLLDERDAGYIERKGVGRLPHYIDTCVAHPTSVEEI